MVGVAQLVRASDCGPEGRGFETHLPPHKVSKQAVCRNADGLFFMTKPRQIELLNDGKRIYKQTELLSDAFVKKITLIHKILLLYLSKCCIMYVYAKVP